MMSTAQQETHRMRKSPRIVTLLVAMLLAASTPNATLAQRDDRYDEINLEMEGIRELDLLAPINLTTKTREDLQKETISDLETDYPAIDRQNDKRVLVAFGLIDPDDDLGQLYGDLLGEQIAGYYNPETDEMVVVSDDTADTEITASNQITYAHETVHVLQDQHFDLETYLDDREDGSDDQSLAITSLIEGDATAAQIEFLISTPSLLLQLSDEIEREDASTEALDNSPAIISETLLFPYDQGQVFITALRDEGGWAEVDDAYASPPASTEQILHPEKYLEGETPLDVELPDVAAALGTGWTVFDTNTMGEFQTSVVLNEGDVSSGTAEDAAEGWGGDRYTVVGTDEQAVILWNSVWDSEDDAQEFANTLAEREADRLEASADENGTITVVESDQGVVQIQVNGDTVSYIFAPDREILDTVAALDP